MHDSSDPLSRHVRCLAGLSQIVETYEVFFIDAWGVLLDGVRAHPGAIDCLQHLRDAAKRVVVVTNAARRESVVAQELHAVGIETTLYHSVVSSGELTWAALARRTDTWHARLGRRCYYLGPERSRGLLEDTGLSAAEHLEAADFVLVTGPLGHNEPDVSAYRALLARAAARHLPMVCANPDLAAIRAGVRGISAGAIAAAYRDHHDGDVYFHGKPHAAIYARAREHAGQANARIVAIGDGFNTDMLGAGRAGLPCVFVAGGIHGIDLNAPDGAARLEALHAEYGCRIDAALQRFSW